MLDKIKGLLRGDEATADAGRALGRGTEPSARLVDTLRVFRVVSPEVEQRVVAFVHSGDEVDVLSELMVRPRPEIDELLGRPGVLSSWLSVSNQREGMLRAVYAGWSVQQGFTARHNLYTLTDGVQPVQIARLARLMHLVAEKVDRDPGDRDAWFTLFVNDLVTTARCASMNALNLRDARRDRWSVPLLADVARAGGVADQDVARCVVRAVLERGESSPYRDPLALLTGLDGLVELMVAERAATAGAVSALSAAGRSQFCLLATDHAPLRDSFADLLARLAADSARSVRGEALRVVAMLPAARQVDLLGAVLRTAPSAALEDVVVHAMSLPDGPEAVAAALAELGDDRRHASRRAVLDGALARAAALAAVEVEGVIDVPPFERLPEVELGEDVLTEVTGVVQELLDRARAELEEVRREPKGERRWRLAGLEQDVKGLSALTPHKLRAALDHLGGRDVAADPAVLRRLGSPEVVRRVSGLTLLHHLRLAATDRDRRHDFSWWAVRSRVDLDVDVRVLADALARCGVVAVEEAIDDLVLSWWSDDVVSPANAWPYYAERPWLVERRLGLRADDPSTARLLDVLGAFPQLPAVFLPALAGLALGRTRTLRRRAQGVLDVHPGVRLLAQEGLRSGATDVRATAAEWLQRLGDADAVPALRDRLAVEKTPVARAALLTALEGLGDDISGALAPDVLLAEARKGLRAKAPVSMAWFDLDALPAVRWAADGAPVPAEVVRWWAVLAVKLKDPSGLGLLARYVGLLDDDGRAALGRHVLSAWVAQDTRGPAPEESRAHAETLAQVRYDQCQEWYRRHPQHYEQEAARSVDDHYRDVYREHQAVLLGSAIKDKGLLALTVAMPADELADAFARYTKAHLNRRAQTEALVQALAANGGAAAVQALLGVSRRFRQATVQETARRLAGELAERRGWSADQLADRTVQSAGFADDGLLHLDLGTREYVGRITPTFTLELTNDAGKVVKALPAARAGDDADVVKAARSRLSASRKELKAVVALQTQRLVEAMCAGRTWQAAEWTEFVLGHPVMSRLAAGLVWVENPGPDQRAFRPGDDGALIDVDDEDVVLGAGSVVGLAHAVTLGREVADAWREHLADYEVRPLFDQLDVDLPDLPADARAIDDHRGWFSDSFSIRGRATKRGYVRSHGEDGGWFTAYTKTYASVGVRVEIEFTGAYLPEENIAAAVTQLVFRRTDRAFGDVGELALADVPAALVAESYRDYVHVAQAGAFEPEWERKSEW